MVQMQWQRPPLTEEQADNLFMLTLDDDAGASSWLAMDDLHFWAMSSFAHSLRSYARRLQFGWYVASLLPVAFDCPKSSFKRAVTPDTFIAFAADHPRSSFDVADEGGNFPSFVLEVVSSASADRDRIEKRHIYDLLGAREYVLFTPREAGNSGLDGYQRDATNQFVPWQSDEQGRLWSDVLRLYLVVRGSLLQAQTVDGQLLLTPEEGDMAIQQVEAENAQLRRELERYRSQGNG